MERDSTCATGGYSPDDAQRYAMTVLEMGKKIVEGDSGVTLNRHDPLYQHERRRFLQLRQWFKHSSRIHMFARVLGATDPVPHRTNWIVQLSAAEIAKRLTACECAVPARVADRESLPLTYGDIRSVVRAGLVPDYLDPDCLAHMSDECELDGILYYAAAAQHLDCRARPLREEARSEGLSLDSSIETAKLAEAIARKFFGSLDFRSIDPITATAPLGMQRLLSDLKEGTAEHQEQYRLCYRSSLRASCDQKLLKRLGEARRKLEEVKHPIPTEMDQALYEMRSSWSTGRPFSDSIIRQGCDILRSLHQTEWFEPKRFVDSYAWSQSHLREWDALPDELVGEAMRREVAGSPPELERRLEQMGYWKLWTTLNRRVTRSQEDIKAIRRAGMEEYLARQDAYVASTLVQRLRDWRSRPIEIGRIPRQAALHASKGGLPCDVCVNEEGDLLLVHSVSKEGAIVARRVETDPERAQTLVIDFVHLERGPSIECYGPRAYRTPGSQKWRSLFARFLGAGSRS